MSFKQFNLDARLDAGIQHAGYEEPTPIQLAAIPAALDGKDLIGTAQTGTGKTAAFVLPILHHLLQGRRGVTRALIVTPTRELAGQIDDTICELAAGTRLRSAAIYGGVGAAPQVKALREGVDILTACPGRLLDLVDQRQADLSKIEILVLDEADRMFDMGFLPSIKRILRLVPKWRQTMLFSATFPPEVEQLASQSLVEPRRISVGINKAARTVAHAVYPVPQHLKTGLLLELLKTTDTGSVLVFTRTKHRARRLAQQIERTGMKVTSLHSDRTQGQRQSALSGFRSGAYRVMVATDIAARGLDVQSISHVINYDIPDTVDAYIHRIGRTGRMERSGDAFTLITPDDHDMVRSIEKTLGKPLARAKLAEFDYSAPAPEKPARPGAPFKVHGKVVPQGQPKKQEPSHRRSSWR